MGCLGRLGVFLDVFSGVSVRGVSWRAPQFIPLRMASTASSGRSLVTSIIQLNAWGSSELTA